jgi:hypothetical protein
MPPRRNRNRDSGRVRDRAMVTVGSLRHGDPIRRLLGVSSTRRHHEGQPTHRLMSCRCRPPCCCLLQLPLGAAAAPAADTALCPICVHLYDLWSFGAGGWWHHPSSSIQNLRSSV